MNILVCFKIVNDFETVMEKDWENTASDDFDISYTKRIIDCYDEAALECALRIRDAALSGTDPVQITSVTIGNGAYDIFYRNMFAVGISRIIQIKTDKDMRFTPYLAASALAKIAEGYDAIIMGCQSSEGNNGQTQYALAHLLGWPCISNVVGIKVREGGLRVRYEREGGFRSATVKTPAVYAMGNSDCPYLRVATLREKLAVAKSTPEIIEYPDLEICEKLPRDFALDSLYRRKTKRQCSFIQGDTSYDKALELYKSYLKDEYV